MSSESEELDRVQALLQDLAGRAEVDGIDYTVLSTRRDESGATILVADRFGLLRVAAHLVALARKQPGAHVHFDESSELEQCDVALTFLLVESRQRP